MTVGDFLPRPDRPTVIPTDPVSDIISRLREPSLTTLDPGNDYFTMINAFEVDPENAERLVDVLQRASGRSASCPASSPQTSICRSTASAWSITSSGAPAHFEAMQKNPDAQPHMREAADLAKSFEPVSYALRHVIDLTDS